MGHVQPLFYARFGICSCDLYFFADNSYKVLIVKNVCAGSGLESALYPCLIRILANRLVLLKVPSTS